MTFAELLIALISISFVFDSAVIHIINMPFSTLLIIYINSVAEILIASIIHQKIKENGKNYL
jgi:hypothetical protein